MSATRYGGRRVNDVLVTSNIPEDRRTAGAEASAAHLRHDRATGYAVLEIKKPWKSRSLGNQEALEIKKPSEITKLRHYGPLETSISNRSALASSMRFT